MVLGKSTKLGLSDWNVTYHRGKFMLCVRLLQKGNDKWTPEVDSGYREFIYTYSRFPAIRTSSDKHNYMLHSQEELKKAQAVCKGIICRTRIVQDIWINFPFFKSGA